MKELEKWRLESCCSGACEITASCIECKQLKAMGWRGALEWMESMIIVVETDPFKHGLTIADLHTIIKKELEDERI